MTIWEPAPGSDWEPWIENFDYEKTWYEVRTPDGNTFVGWPNAGKINGLDHRDNIMVRRVRKA